MSDKSEYTSAKKRNNMVKKIVLDVNGKELALTLEAARSLYEALRDVVGSKEAADTNPNWWYLYPYQYPRYYGPWVTYTSVVDSNGTLVTNKTDSTIRITSGSTEATLT